MAVGRVFQSLTPLYVVEKRYPALSILISTPLLVEIGQTLVFYYFFACKDVGNIAKNHANENSANVAGRAMLALYCVYVNIIFCEEELFLSHEHGVPGWKLDGLLLGELEDFLGDVLLVDHYAEHVLIEPFVGHNQVAIVTAGCAP